MKSNKQPLVSITKKDLIRQTFRCGGKGGQNVNKVETGVRFIHEPSGARAESCTHRHQHQNEMAAFQRLAKTPELQNWLKIESARKMGQKIPETPEQIKLRVDRMVDEDLMNGNIKEELF